MTDGDVEMSVFPTSESESSILELAEVPVDPLIQAIPQCFGGQMPSGLFS